MVLPAAASAKTVLDIYTKHSCVFTNVPGPQTPITIGGARVVDFEAAIGNAIPQLSAVSYDGAIRFSVCVDPALVPDAHRLAEFFYDELRALECELGLPDGGAAA